MSQPTPMGFPFFPWILFFDLLFGVVARGSLTFKLRILTAVGPGNPDVQVSNFVELLVVYVVVTSEIIHY